MFNQKTRNLEKNPMLIYVQTKTGMSIQIIYCNVYVLSIRSPEQFYKLQMRIFFIFYSLSRDVIFHRKQFSFPKSLMAIDSAIFIFISLFFVGIHHLYSLDSKYLFVAYQAWQRNRKYQLILMTNYKFVVINYCMVSRLIN